MSAHVRAGERASVLVLGGSVWRVRVLTSLEELARYTPEMRGVHTCSAQQSPFTTPEFIATYASHNEYYATAGSLELVILCAFAGDELMGYLPLKRIRDHAGPVGFGKLEFLCTHDSELPHVVARRGDEGRVGAALVEYLLGHEPDFSMLELAEQPATSPLLSGGMPPEVHGFYARKFPGLETATINVRWPTLSDYYDDFNKKFRSNVCRQVRKLLTLDGVELLSARRPEALEPLFELYLDLEQRSWKSSAGATIGRHPARVAFFRDLIDKGAPFALSIDVLCAAGEPIAGIINGRHCNRMYALQVAYDEEVGANAPGLLMLLWSMKGAIEDRIAAYHLLHGSAYYKTRWLADVTATESMQFFRVGSLAHIKARLGEARRWVGNLHPRAATETKYNADKRQIVSQARPPRPLAVAGASRELVSACKRRDSVVVRDGQSIASSMPFYV